MTVLFRDICGTEWQCKRIKTITYLGEWDGKTIHIIFEDGTERHFFNIVDIDII